MKTKEKTYFDAYQSLSTSHDSYAVLIVCTSEVYDKSFFHIISESIIRLCQMFGYI